MESREIIKTRTPKAAEGDKIAESAAMERRRSAAGGAESAQGPPGTPQERPRSPPGAPGASKERPRRRQGPPGGPQEAPGGPPGGAPGAIRSPPRSLRGAPGAAQPPQNAKIVKNRSKVSALPCYSLKNGSKVSVWPRKVLQKCSQTDEFHDFRSSNTVFYDTFWLKNR